jgi:hypothetical protein
VPSHSGIEGNETAYQLARLGFVCPFIGPEPALGILAGIAKKAVRDRRNRNHKEFWESLTGIKHAKGFLQGPSARRITQLNRNQLWWVTVLLNRTLSSERNTF